jgi:hypothetical protein
MVAWDSEPSPDISIRIEYIDYFNARGMRRVYGRGDVFPTKCIFNMDVWLDRRGRLLARFWSRSNDVDGRSLEIRGISVDAIPKREPSTALSDAWIPQTLREEYEDWIRGEW